MKHFRFVVLFTLITNTFFFCTDSDNNPVDLKRPGVEIVYKDGTKQDTIAEYVNQEIEIMVSVLFPDELDSISYHTGNGFSGSLSQFESTSHISVKFAFTAPCTTSIIVTGLKNNLAVTSDTAALFVSEPLTLKINPLRLYASASLPCTLKVSLCNRYTWKQVTLIPQITADSLLIWVPTENDIGKKTPVSMIAIDNGINPIIVKDSVYITVIADNELLTPPVNLKIDRRTQDIVRISWDRDSLADSYILYRRDPDVDSTWEAIALSNTSYIDLTEKAIMYRVSSVNYFGASTPSEIIYLIDTVHYAHRVFFADSISTVSEGTASHFIKLKVAMPAIDEITAWCSLIGNSEIEEDFGSLVYLARIATGDTFGLCTLNIIDNSLTEQNKYYSLSLDSVTHGFISGQQFHNILLVDDDSLFSVIYEPNGAEVGNVPVDFRHYDKNDVAIVMGNTENLIKIGFSFVGWKKSSADTTGKLYTPGDTLILDSAGIRLHAQWQVIKHSVIYHENGNTEGRSSVVEEFGWEEKITIAAKPDDFQKAGFTFKGWNTAKNGTGDTLFPGDSLKTSTTSTTLYALWEIIKCVVRYDGNGNDTGNVPELTVYNYGTKFVVSDNSLDLKKEFCLFNGWNTAQDGSGVSLSPGDSFSSDVSNIVLYAQWKPVPPVIITHPKDTSVRAGNRVLLTVQVSGAGLSFQWQKNETDIIGATSDTLVIDSATRYDSASYRCITGNAEGSVISNPAALNVISVASVSAGRNHTLILMTDGTAWGTGSNESGQLGIGNLTKVAIPAYIMSDVSMVSAGQNSSFLLNKYGTLYRIQNNSSNILTSKAASIYAIPAIPSSETNSVMVLRKDSSLFIYASSDSTKLADSVTCFHGSPDHLLFTKKGILYAAGTNSHGQFGNGTTKGASASDFIKIEEDVSAIFAGTKITLIIKNGYLYTAGFNKYGQLGNGTFQNTLSFTLVASNVTAVSGCHYHSMTIKDNGTLYGTGFNEFGQLGIYTTEEQISSFVPVMTEVNSVSTGNYHSMIIKKDGTLWATGYNSYGQLGIGNYSRRYKPELVKF